MLSLQSLTFKTDIVRDWESGVIRRHGVLSVASMRSTGLVERGHSITGLIQPSVLAIAPRFNVKFGSNLEVPDILADLVHYAGDIIAFVTVRVLELWPFPILGIAPGYNDFDHELIISRRWNGSVPEMRLGTCGNGEFKRHSRQSNLSIRNPERESVKSMQRRF